MFTAAYDVCVAVYILLTYAGRIIWALPMLTVTEEISMSTFGNNDVITSKRPQDTNFKQQKLPAWQPIITAKTILPLLFAVGLVFIPLGIALLVASNNISEMRINYTDETCKSIDHDMTCLEFLKSNTGKTCECEITFKLENNFTGPVYMYYGLTNFYQNHRRYVRSRDDHQLLGDKLDYYHLNHDCDPYRGVLTDNSSFPYAPCGAIANSLFNDTFELFYTNNNNKQHEVDLINTGIAWSTDKTSKFNNPPGFDKNPEAAFNNTLHPPNWQKPIYELDVKNNDNNGYENEDLMVWMRTAALPNFRKLYRRINMSGLFADGLPAGNYTFKIYYSYPTWSFEGSKFIFLSTTSWMGGKNPFLGIAYLLVGSLCVVLGIVFLVIHLNFDKSKNIHDFDHLHGF